ncbi:hypothetical protein phytr_50 [Candidatus Phycorickettsia trachydisci]|uniref:PIN domain-containing protein n=1 Tax=Candidatus Phycorickettsia trachydisci TaxID=2115978 RepID=A0A2P1P6R5_9RICK|nr:hypothetical protein phytr_50 [Candidatus Phycorickettsia trachydisci]
MGIICCAYNTTAIDGLVASSALVYNLQFVARDIKDFEQVQGLKIINPWQKESTIILN